MTRAFGALCRREVRRGWPQSRLALLGATVAGVAALVFAPATALVIGICAAMVSLMIPFGPIADLRQDKTQGYLEFDRQLPVAHRTIALSRMLGIAVRLLPALALCVPLIVALARKPEHGAAAAFIGGAVAVGGWCLLTAGTWAFIAVNARWNLRRLWWLPMTIAFGPRIVIAMLPPAAKDAISHAAVVAGTAVGHFATTALGAVVLLALLLSTPLLVLLFSVALFATALEHYQHDTTISEVARLPAPKRELGAIGRGPVLAVARCSIRLATEQPRRRVVLLVVFLAALFFGSVEIKRYAQIYVRTLALFLPGAVVLQLTTARALGYLEGLRQLPHRPTVVAMGHLLALVILAIPGAAIWILARAVGGTAPTAGNVTALVALMVSWTWIACVGAVWLTRRRTLTLAGAAVVLASAWLLYLGVSDAGREIHRLVAAVGRLRASSGAALAIMFALSAMVVGLPLFARGVDEYEPSQATQQRAEKWLARRRR
jgi:hypothetical protein